MACSIMIKDQEHKMEPEPGLHYKSQKFIFGDRALIDISHNILKKTKKLPSLGLSVICTGFGETFQI